MSLEQQEARICEAPKSGWVIWLSEEAMNMVRVLLEDYLKSNPTPDDLPDRKLVEDILEGTY